MESASVILSKTMIMEMKPPAAVPQSVCGGRVVDEGRLNAFTAILTAFPERPNLFQRKCYCSALTRRTSTDGL